MMKKPLRVLLWVVALAVVIVIGGLIFFGGQVVMTAVNTGGPKLLGVPVTLDHARFQPLRGHLTLSKLHIGNPEGFKTESLFDVERVEVDLDPQSLFTDTIVVRRVIINAPKITLERGLKKSNLTALMENLQGPPPAKTPGEKPAPEKNETAADQKSGKKVVIEDLKVTGGQVNLSVTLAQGVAASIALAEIRMTNIGREEGATGLGVPDIVRIILTTIVKSVLQTAGNVGGAAVEGVTAVGGMAVDGASAVGNAAVNGVSTAGGAAVDGVKKLGGGLGRAVGGLMGKEEKPQEPKPESKP